MQNNIPLLYDCTILATKLMKYNENINNIKNQMQKETTELQVQVTTIHQKFEETMFKINQIAEQLFEYEQKLIKKKSDIIVQQRKDKLDKYKEEREKTLDDLKKSFQFFQ